MNKRNFTQAVALATVCATSNAASADSAVLPSTRTLPSAHNYETLVARVEAAVAEQKWA